MLQSDDNFQDGENKNNNKNKEKGKKNDPQIHVISR